MPDRVLREAAEVLLLVERARSHEARHAVRARDVARVVADEEVRARLRGREDPVLPDDLVPDEDRREDARDADREERRSLDPPSDEQEEDGDARDDEDVPAEERTDAEERSGAPPPPRAAALPLGGEQRRGRQREDEGRERGLLRFSGVVDRGRVESRHPRGCRARGPREERGAEPVDDEDRRHVPDHLEDQHEEDVRAEDAVDERHQIRIERVLVEDSRPEDVAREDAARPRVVRGQVERQVSQERRAREEDEVRRA